MNIWCVKPEEVKRELTFTDSEGGRHPFWIKMKRYLNIGEERRMRMAGWDGLRQDAKGVNAEVRINFQVQSFATAETYLTDWSLADDNDKKMALNRETIESLAPEVYQLIEGAINDHIKEMVEEKKVTPGSASPVATLAS